MPEALLEYVEHDNNYVTVTDSIGNIHHIDTHLIEDELFNKIKNGDVEMGDDIIIWLNDDYVYNNGMVL